MTIIQKSLLATVQKIQADVNKYFLNQENVNLQNMMDVDLIFKQYVREIEKTDEERMIDDENNF